MSFTLIGSPASPFVRKINVILLEKGLDFDIDPVIPFNPTSEFLAASPLGKIPALRHGDRVVNDSSVIARYLDRIEPKPPLYPKDAYASARAEWFEEYGDGALVPVIGPGIFFPLVLAPLMQGAEPDEARAAKVMADDLPRHFDYLNDQIGDREFFVGDALSIADLGVASPLANLRLAGFVPDEARWPGLHSFVKRIHARPAFEAVMAPQIEAMGKRWVVLD